MMYVGLFTADHMKHSEFFNLYHKQPGETLLLDKSPSRDLEVLEVGLYNVPVSKSATSRC